MDVGALRLAIGGLRDDVERASSPRNPPPLRRDIDALEERLRTIAQCLDSADPRALARWRSGLGQVGHAIFVAVERARQDIESAAKASDTRLPSRPFHSSSHVEKCSTDIRECVLLADFTLSVLSLPTGSQAQRETEDLRIAARLLHEAQGRSGEERTEALQTRRSSNPYSAGFRHFVERVLEVERGFVSLQHESAQRDIEPAQALGADSATQRVRDRDELHFPTGPVRGPARSGEALPPYPEARSRSRQLSYPGSPREVYPRQDWSYPNEKALPSPPAREVRSKRTDDSPGSTTQQIPRRPVARAATTPIPTSSASLPSNSAAGFGNRLSQNMAQRMRSRASRRTGTRELFTQASRSLSNLTHEFETSEPPELPSDLPPPYVENVPNGNTSPPPRDVKRRPHAESVSSVLSQNMSVFALVQDNLVENLQERIKRGASVNEVDPLTKRTALMEAARLEHVTIVGIMLKSSNQVHQKDLDGNSALHYAALQGNAAICTALLDAGAAVEDYNREGDTPISFAARGGHTAAVDALLNSWTIQRGTAAALTKGYMEALRSGNVNTVSAFIERHIKPKKIKESVLCAAEGGSVPTLDFILAQKANLKERSPEGWTALHFAAEKGHIAMVEKLLALGLPWKASTKKSGENALAIAIRNRQISTANALILHKDAKVNRDDDDRVTPLHHAVRIGDLGLMTTLLNAGAKLDVESKYGWNIMHTAAGYGHAHLVAELITRGVSIEEKLDDAEVDRAQKTNEGARRGYWAEIRWPHTGSRPLDLSLEFGHDEVANMLIAAGAKIDVPDGKGWRPLHYAAFSVRPAIVELLLNRGASPHATTDDNTTPLGLGFRAYGLDASEEDKIRVWELLQGAMNATKKSKRKQFSDFMSGSSAGKHVEKRNKVWHTAELAASLHLNEPTDDGGGSGEGSDITASVSERRQSLGDAQEVERVYSRASFGYEGKSPPR